MSKLKSYNPANNEMLGSVKISSVNEIKQKVSNAQDAFITWGVLSIKKRLELLKNVYIALEKRQDEISQLACQEMGFPIRDQKLFDMSDGLNYFKWYLENSKKILSPQTTLDN
ncbi:hypothetical protein COX08_04710, partial [Candidatus Beckwithbacteria bacterium CG23_combo_of_CG06-09_8_20_14_all_34_8]